MSGAGDPGRERRLSLLPVLVFLVLVALTAASIYLVYGRSYFARWPWLQASVTLSLLTCLWPMALRWRKGPDIIESVVYGLGTVCAEIILVYPGIKRLGLVEDPKVYVLIFVLGIIHGGGIKLIWRWDSGPRISGRARRDDSLGPKHGHHPTDAKAGKRRT